MYIIILLLYIKNNKTTNEIDVIHTIFQKPIKKKSVIFLRAPYKNKLARLSILKVEFTTTVSIKCKKNINCSDLNHIYSLANYNFSTHKLQHKKTKITFFYKYTKNFKISNFLINMLISFYKYLYITKFKSSLNINNKKNKKNNIYFYNDVILTIPSLFFRKAHFRSLITYINILYSNLDSPNISNYFYLSKYIIINNCFINPGFFFKKYHLK